MSVNRLIGVEFNEYQLCAVVIEQRRKQWHVCGRYWQDFDQRISLFDEPVKLAPLLNQFKKLRKQIPGNAKHVALVLPDSWVMQKTMQVPGGATDHEQHYAIEQRLSQTPMSIQDVAMDFCTDSEPQKRQPLQELSDMTQSVRVVMLKKRLQTTLINQLNKAGFNAYFFGPHTHALMSVNHWANLEKSTPWANLHLSQTQWSAVTSDHALCRYWQSSQLNLSNDTSPYAIEQTHVIAALNKVLLQIELSIDKNSSENEAGVWLSCDFDSELKVVQRLEHKLESKGIRIEPMPSHIQSSAMDLGVTLDVGVMPVTGERMMLLATGVALCAIAWGQHHALG
jgi:Tfp pilus assembly PilM family ATPase